MSNNEKLVEKYIRMTAGAGVYEKYPNIEDRAHWDWLSDELKDALVKVGEEARKEPWTQLLISDFREFSKSGNRVQFEDKYFPRRRKLNALVMAECVENKGRFLDDILDGLYLILEETTWCLPPHTSYERDAAQETMPDVTRPIIDLFQAESGAEVAYAEYLLRPELAKISPYISVFVNERLKERIFTPYLNQHFWWMGNGDEPMCNWTPWITQNVLICALTREKSFFTEEERRVFLEKATVSCDYFLKDYGDDGGCSEGAQYYTHAGLCLFGCLELISGATNLADSGIFTEKKIRNIANFIVKMHAAGGYYVNFADCSALPGRRTAREYLFGKAIGDEVLMSFAAEDFKTEELSQRLIEDEINLFYHVMQAFSYDEMLSYPKTEALPEDSWFESMGLMVARDKNYVLAAKAGNNGDSHNHNDVGSFTVYKDGEPFIIDLGVGTYTRETFSDKRYELWTMQSQFHNLPTFINTCAEAIDATTTCSYAAETDTLGIIDRLGKDSAADYYNPKIIMQKDGTQYAASEVNCILCTNQDSKSGKAISSLKMDIAGAYVGSAIGNQTSEECTQIGKFIRTVSLHKGDCITVDDHYEGTLDPVISIMTYEKPEILTGEYRNGKQVSQEAQESDHCVDLRIGSLGTINAIGYRKAYIRRLTITDERLKIAWKHDVYRILLVADESVQDYKLLIK